MKVIVTGASGFIGSRVFDQLKLSGMEAIGVSRNIGLNKDLFKVDDYRDCPKGDVLIHLAESNDRALVNSLGEKHVYRGFFGQQVHNIKA